MSEGLLKKRIREEAFSPSYDAHAKLIFVRVLDKILDEAKQEFPVTGWLFGIEHDLSEEENAELYRWFQKWFGEAKKKT